MIFFRSLLPADRTQTGELWLVDTTADYKPPVVLWGPVPCLGKADNQMAADHGNPSRDPTLPYGDHPLGEYEITGWAPTAKNQEDTYGPDGKLVLDPVAGQALLAKRNGRYGLLLHGGKLGGPYALGFRPTAGCLRLLNADMWELVTLWKQYGVTRYVAERTP